MHPYRQHGMTLVEISVVLLILIALAGLAVPYIGGAGYQAACEATQVTLTAVRDAIIGAGFAPGYLGDTGALPTSPRDLFRKQAGMGDFNPNTRRGWHGPYLANGILAHAGVMGQLHNTFTDPTLGAVTAATKVQADDALVLDGYQGKLDPVILQIPTVDNDGNDCKDFFSNNAEDCARLVSAGPDGVLDTLLSDAKGANRGDDRVLFLRVPDPGRNPPCSD